MSFTTRILNYFVWVCVIGLIAYGAFRIGQGYLYEGLTDLIAGITISFLHGYYNSNYYFDKISKAGIENNNG